MKKFQINEFVKFTGKTARVPYGTVGRVSHVFMYEQMPGEFYNVIFPRLGEYTVDGSDLRRVEVVNGVVQEVALSQALANLCLALWSVSLAVRPLGSVVVHGERVAVYDESGQVLPECAPRGER